MSKIVQEGLTFDDVLLIPSASGIFHVLPVKKAPLILPTAHQLRTVRSDTTHLRAISLTEK